MLSLWRERGERIANRAQHIQEFDDILRYAGCWHGHELSRDIFAALDANGDGDLTVREFTVRTFSSPLRPAGGLISSHSPHNRHAILAPGNTCGQLTRRLGIVPTAIISFSMCII